VLLAGTTVLLAGNKAEWRPSNGLRPSGLCTVLRGTMLHSIWVRCAAKHQQGVFSFHQQGVL
jgi:hypothetical protein